MASEHTKTPDLKHHGKSLQVGGGSEAGDRKSPQVVKVIEKVDPKLTEEVKN